MSTRLVLSSDDLDQLAADAEHLNGHYPDAVGFVARHLGGLPVADDAEIIGVEADGVVISVPNGDGTPRSTRIGYTTAPDSLEAVRAELQQLIRRARACAGDGVPQTSLEREIEAATTIRTFHTRVVSTRCLTPTMREVTFQGGLDQFSAASPDQFLLVTPGTPDAKAGRRAYYTVRRWRPDLGELDLWFVLHPHPGSVSEWAAQATPGDPVTLWGPRSSFAPPADTRSLLLVADETGIPGVCAILEQRTGDLPATVVLETTDHRHTVDLPIAAHDRLRWVFRGEGAPGTTGRLLSEITALSVDPDGLYAFGAAETREIAAVRRHLKATVGMPRERIQMTGYWRRRRAG